ncbi:AAA family ATPase [Nocardiopsis tropica]|uniref:AAA family ATPase n=1 Tax=Nocardiopsis tropica TaxID=109330 RepID=A0ABU7KM18_9ACTN|nr:AAA family ATPase [Nocardiopsis umidischolae]MEE2050327.1 AAA family ATPase [Nocardiopsis umidischolae]
MDDPPVTPPTHDLDTERAVLGAMLTSEKAATTVSTMLTPGDLYGPHSAIYTAIQTVRRRDGHADILRVWEILRTDPGVISAGGAAYISALPDACPVPASAGHYANTIRSIAVRRRLHAAGLNIAQGAAADVGTDDTLGHVAGLAEKAIQELEAVRDYEAGEELTTPTIVEFLGVEDDPYDWVIPGLLERGDRLILTGMEGLGKTTLFRQIAVTLAAGIHPFTGAPIPAKTVLIVDVENSTTQARRALRPLWAKAHTLESQEPQETNLWIEVRPEGLDLANDRDVSWLLRRVAVLKPDLVALGPLYRLAPRALNSDDEAAPILAALNLVRARGCALLLEAHAGHATLGHGGKRDLRPRGSSALMGWPEFGYGIRPSDAPNSNGSGRRVELVSWRGDRDERDWPEELESGGAWPWSEALPSGYVPTNPWAK